ncbi:MAG: ATP-binding domain-containing protein, partial [Armatimonadetes bacterium]|nr:ATP-binding domain-containing protein [Armatimonadota bacterium]
IGRGTAIGDQRVTVEFALGPVDYERDELGQLDLAYALTVHKSQGSEYPAVIMVVHSTHYIMLRRNLLYTALTRAERMALLIGNRRGLWRAIRTAPARERMTRLAGRLTGQFEAEPLDLPVTRLSDDDVPWS